MRMTPANRFVGKALVLALAAQVLPACGGSAPPRSPARGDGRGGYRYEVAKAASDSYADEDGEPDRDADGIPDQEDMAGPAEPAPAPGNMLAQPTAPPPPPPPHGGQAAQPTASDPRPGAEEPTRDASMMIYTARITMAVYQVDHGLATVEKVAKDMGGYLSLKRDREITIRVPRARFEPALAAIDTIGDVLHRDVQAQDVSDEYVDLEVRIKNARAMQARLKQLLERAPVKEALEIEKELHRVTEQLELFEGKLKLLKDKIAFSTITVVFQARGSTIQATRIRLPFPWLPQLGLPNLLNLREDK
jgi:hypothetical protein